MHPIKMRNFGKCDTKAYLLLDSLQRASNNGMRRSRRFIADSGFGVLCLGVVEGSRDVQFRP